MENKEVDEETYKDQPCCSHQLQEDKEEKQHIDKVAILHQALSEASAVRAQRCKQQRFASSGKKACDAMYQSATGSGFFESSKSSEEIVEGIKEFMDQGVLAIKNHTLYPIVELLAKKCEAATWNMSKSSFLVDDVYEQIIEMISNGDVRLGDSELDIFLINSIMMLRVHLLELEKVAELCIDFKMKYLQTLKKKMNQEFINGCSGDSDDDLCNFSSEPPGQSKNLMAAASQTTPEVTTLEVSAPPPDSSASSFSTFYRSLFQSRALAHYIPAIHRTEKEDGSNSKKRPHLPPKAVYLLRAWLSLHSSHPYPSEEEKAVLSRKTGLQLVQIKNWFVNARRRMLMSSKESVNSAAGDSTDVNLTHKSSSAPEKSFIPKKIRSYWEHFVGDHENDDFRQFAVVRRETVKSFLA